MDIRKIIEFILIDIERKFNKDKDFLSPYISFRLVERDRNHEYHATIIKSYGIDVVVAGHAMMFDEDRCSDYTEEIRKEFVLEKLVEEIISSGLNKMINGDETKQN